MEGYYCHLCQAKGHSDIWVLLPGWSRITVKRRDRDGGFGTLIDGVLCPTCADQLDEWAMTHQGKGDGC